MKNLKTFVTECYEKHPTLSNCIRNFKALSENVNNVLRADNIDWMTDTTILSTVQPMCPNAEFEEVHDNNEKTMRTLRATKQVSLSDEEKNRLQSTIREALATTCQSEGGWYNMVTIAPRIKEYGLDYKALGFGKFIDMLTTVFGDDIEIEDRGDKTKKYVHLKVDKKTAGKTSSPTKIKLTPSISSKDRIGKRVRLSAHDKLMNFAVFPNKGGENGFALAIKELAGKALAENWYYGAKDDNPGNYPILRNYIEYTFERLLAEEEEHACDTNWEHKILTTDNNAVFNTGLVDHLYEPIYAVFNRNFDESSDRRWWFWTFVKSNDKEHQQLTRIFGTKLPAPAHYYNCCSELVYNIKAEIGSYNWDHFIDNCDRLPKEFLRDNGPKFDYDHLNSKSDYKRLAEQIKSDGRCMNRIKNRIQDAIEHAIKRVRWNFKTAIPIYYPSQKKISLLLPLALVNEDVVDVALVLEATSSGAYIAHTILTLPMAYNNARLITRPQSDWLDAKKISVNKQMLHAEDVA